MCTKSKIISAYDGHSWKTSRQDSEKEQTNPAAVLSIVGTVQPKMLPNLFSPTDVFSGLLPRFIFIRADRQLAPLLSDEIFTGQPLLRQITANLLAMEMHIEDNQPKPGRVHLTDEAYGAFHQWHDMKMTEAWHGSEMDQSISAKLIGQTARIALLLHCLKAVLDGTDSLAPLEESTMLEAINIGNWIQSHQKQIWLSMGIVDEPTLSPLERAIMETALEIDSTETILNQDFNAKIISSQNYDLVRTEQIYFMKFIENRIAELNSSKATRHDAVYACGLIFSASPEYFEGINDAAQRHYFEVWLEYLGISGEFHWTRKHRFSGCPP